MMILLSCAKTMCDTTGIKAPALTVPKFGKEASDIILQLTEYSPDKNVTYYFPIGDGKL